MKIDLIDGATIRSPKLHRPPDFKELWNRAWENLQADISGLLCAATKVADFCFFEAWGEVCMAVVEHAFGFNRILSRIKCQDGEWKSEILRQNLEERKATRSLLMEICTARLNLYFDLGRLPTNPETADEILKWREAEKRLDPNQSRESHIRTVSTTVRRRGLSTCVVTSQKNAETD
jgi:hypothetical protein